MQESAYRIRAAEAADAPLLREAIVRTLAHSESGARRTSYKAAADRGELMVLERHNPRDRSWKPEGFVEYHLRVDDTLTIRDIGSSSDPPSSTAVKYLLLHLVDTARAVSATLKVREDAVDWKEILGSIPGFEIDGREYRRPHYVEIWRWSREAAQRSQGQPGMGRRGPR